MTKEQTLRKIKDGLDSLVLHPDYREPDKRIPIWNLVKQLGDTVKPAKEIDEKKPKVYKRERVS